MTHRAHTPRSWNRQMRRHGIFGRNESARQQRKAMKLVRREVKVAKLLEDWRSRGLASANLPDEFSALMESDHRALRGEPPLTEKGTRSSTGPKVAVEVPQDKQNNTHLFGGSRAYSTRWHEIRRMK